MIWKFSENLEKDLDSCVHNSMTLFCVCGKSVNMGDFWDLIKEMKSVHCCDDCGYNYGVIPYRGRNICIPCAELTCDYLYMTDEFNECDALGKKIDDFRQGRVSVATHE
jgi:hypothetical protein